MRKLLLIALFWSFSIQAQDKLFFSDGTTRKGNIVTNTKDFIYFKTTDTSRTEKISKNKLILIEDYKGTRYLLSPKDTKSETSSELTLSKKDELPRNSLSIQPLAIFFGRLNLSYEHLSKDGRVGVVVPLILTYDPSFGNIFNVIDSSRLRIKGVKFITGLDINFYSERGTSAKLFAGPRIRYGTDLAFFNTEALTVQTQLGIKLSKPSGKIVQHFSIGFGFIKILSSAALVADRNQSLLWYSINYRLGVKW